MTDATYARTITIHARAIRTAMANGTIDRDSDVIHAAVDQCRDAASAAGFHNTVGISDFWDEIQADEVPHLVEIKNHQEFANQWQARLNEHRFDIGTRDHGDCVACRELAASARYNRYAVRMYLTGQTPLTGAAWAAGERARIAQTELPALSTLSDRGITAGFASQGLRDALDALAAASRPQNPPTV